MLIKSKLVKYFNMAFFLHISHIKINYDTSDKCVQAYSSLLIFIPHASNYLF